VRCTARRHDLVQPVHGNRQRGTGILNNELYIGRLVWNREPPSCRTTSSIDHSRLRSGWRLAIELYQHAVVDIGPERFFDCLQISSVAVSSELYAIRQSAPKIVHYHQRELGIAPAN
jgi:hypothetical protein